MQRGYKSFAARLAKAEIVLWQAQKPDPALMVIRPAPPAFDDVLAKFDIVLDAIDAGKCSFWCGYFNSCAPTQEEHSRLCWPCQDVSRAMREYGFEVEPTVAAYRDWIVEHGRWIAFAQSCTDDELDALASADETDPILWTAAQRQVMSDYTRLVRGDGPLSE